MPTHIVISLVPISFFHAGRSIALNLINFPAGIFDPQAHSSRTGRERTTEEYRTAAGADSLAEPAGEKVSCSKLDNDVSRLKTYGALSVLFIGSVRICYLIAASHSGGTLVSTAPPFALETVVRRCRVIERVIVLALGVAQCLKT